MAKTNLKVVKKTESKVRGNIDDFNLDLGFIEAVLDALFIASPDELNHNTIPALIHEARNKLLKIKDYGTSLWDVAEGAGIVKIAQ